MRQYELKEYPDGSRQVIVWYTDNQYDQAIKQARSELGSEADKLPVLAKPVNRPPPTPGGT